MYLVEYMCFYGVECKRPWVRGCSVWDINKEGRGATGSVSAGLSQWRWSGDDDGGGGGGWLRGRWWPWRSGPGCGWCYSFCRARVRPEGSSPGCPPPTAESHSPAGDISSVSVQHDKHTHSPPLWAHSLTR